MSHPPTSPDDAALRDLSRRRATLDDAGWTELYRICTRALTGQCRDLLGALPGPAEGYILDYIEDKLLVDGEQEGEIVHVGALVEFYRRYLTSRLREAYLRRRHSPSHTDADGEPADPLDSALVEEALVRSAGGDADAAAELVDLVELALTQRAAPGDGGPALAVVEASLERYLGLRLGALLEAAQAFLAARDDWAYLAGDTWWITLYLREHFCPDREHATPLSTLAKRHQIPSYHDKALRLGVTVPLASAKAAVSFSASLRARWLASVGIPCDADHHVEVAIALKVLCLAALTAQEHRPQEERP